MSQSTGIEPVPNKEEVAWGFKEVDAGFDVYAGEEYICTVGGDRTEDEARVLAQSIVNGINFNRLKTKSEPEIHDFTPAPWRWWIGHGIWKFWDTASEHNWLSHKVADTYFHDELITPTQAEENARRIVAVINLVDDIPTDVLERVSQHETNRQQLKRFIASMNLFS